MRLIDADALLEHIKTYCDGCNSYGGVMCRACGYGDAIDAIEDAPTVDAVPVKDLEALVDFFYIDGCISKRYLTMLHGLIDMHKKKDGDE